MFYDDFSHCESVIIGTSRGDHIVTMFSGIVKDLVKDIDVEGASMTEKLLQVPMHKFHVNAKDIAYSVND